jgi:predicted enzyme involved in methoxymalonyl-ACP biosynthesis
LTIPFWDGTLLEFSNVKLKDGIIEIVKGLDSRGIVNSIASKNNYEDAIAKLKDSNVMGYFIYPQINWNAKSGSLNNIKTNINISFDTIPE